MLQENRTVVRNALAEPISRTGIALMLSLFGMASGILVLIVNLYALTEVAVNLVTGMLTLTAGIVWISLIYLFRGRPDVLSTWRNVATLMSTVGIHGAVVAYLMVTYLR